MEETSFEQKVKLIPAATAEGDTAYTQIKSPLTK